MAEIVRIAPESNQSPDAHGQAALILAESMLHALVEAGVFTTETAIDILNVAEEVKEEKGKAFAESAAVIAKSLNLLNQIARSFAADNHR